MSPRKTFLLAAGGLGAVCLLGVVLVFLTPFGWLLIPAGQAWYAHRNLSEFDRNRPHYEAIIRGIERVGPPSSYDAYYLIPSNNPEHLKKWDEQTSIDKSSGDRIVRALSWKGILFVTIGTYDMGHAGGWYLIFSSRSDSDREISDIVYPGRATKVDPHWWAVDDNSR